MNKRICLACKEPIVGRSDKRFCRDGCRNLYNNQRNSVPNRFVRGVNVILKQNRRILRELLGEENRAKVSRDKLLSSGMQFDFYTNQLRNAKGENYFFVYEFGYLPLNKEVYIVVRKDLSEYTRRKKSLKSVYSED